MSYLKRIEAVLDHNTINRGLTQLHKEEDFHVLKKTYESLRENLKQDGDMTDEEASSLINYAIHKEFEKGNRHDHG